MQITNKIFLLLEYKSQAELNLKARTQCHLAMIYMLHKHFHFIYIYK